MKRIGIHELFQAVSRTDADRDLEAPLRRALARLEPDLGLPSGGAPPVPRREVEAGEPPLSELFLALCESVAGCYLEQKRPQSAAGVVWEAFAARPRLAEYRALKDWALRAGDWPGWQTKARNLLDATRDADLVGILLWEGQVDEAWTRARERGATEAQWLELARRREQDHPEEALDVYRARVEHLLSSSDPSGYRESVRWLRRLESLYGELGREPEFAGLLAQIRLLHRRRPRLIRALEDAFGPGTPAPDEAP